MSAAERRLRISAVNVIGRGTLLGTVDLKFSGMRLRSCAVIIKHNNSVFVGLPRAACIGRDGRQTRDAAGKLEFDRQIEWIDPDIGRRFQAAVLDLIERDHPALLGRESPQPPVPLPLPAPRRRRPIARTESAPPLPDDPLDDIGRGGRSHDVY